MSKLSRRKRRKQKTFAKKKGSAKSKPVVVKTVESPRVKPGISPVPKDEKVVVGVNYRKKDALLSIGLAFAIAVLFIGITYWDQNTDVLLDLGNWLTNVTNTHL